MTTNDFSRLSVLIADRDESDRARLAMIVEEACAGAIVDVAVSGPDMFDALRRRIYDLVFIDLSLPRVDVVKLKQVFEEIRQRRTSKLVLTAAKLPTSWIDIARRLHAYDVLVKPFKPEAVSGLVVACLRQRAIKKALIVDEGEKTRELVARSLEGGHFDMTAAGVESGALAARAIRLERYDLALVDFALSDIEPIELACRILRESGEHTKVVMMDRQMEHTHKNLDVFGIAGVVIKPFDPVALDRCLHASFGLWRPYLVNAELDARNDCVFSPAMPLDRL